MQGVDQSPSSFDFSSYLLLLLPARFWKNKIFTEIFVDFFVEREEGWKVKVTPFLPPQLFFPFRSIQTAPRSSSSEMRDAAPSKFFNVFPEKKKKCSPWGQKVELCLFPPLSSLLPPPPPSTI